MAGETLRDSFVAIKTFHMKQMTALDLSKHPWYKQWFDSRHYHILYGIHDRTEAADFTDHLLSELKPKRHSRMIDVGCGKGRHCLQLASHGHQVTGIDLSFQSIRQAKKLESPNLRFLQHDMRRNFGYCLFDYVFNFFTSFGYFKDQEEHDQVMMNMADALKPGGTLVIDYINVYKAAVNLKTSELKEIDGVVYHINRWVTESHFYKKIVINDQRPGPAQEHIEQVARFNREDFNKMFVKAGLQLAKVYGDYEMNPYDCRESPRLIMIAKKTGEEM